MKPAQSTATHIGLGFAIQTDPFQSGREAAQMAKRQLEQGAPDLVIALGPSHVHFQDFIEGVRLVTGEDVLVGVPTSRVFSNELFAPQTCVVILIQSSLIRFSIASTPLPEGNSLVPGTSLFSKFRSLRGNARVQYDHHGLLVLESHPAAPQDSFTKYLGMEAGLESWMVKLSPHQSAPCPLMCHDQILGRGCVALECLSNAPIGVSQVEIGAFKNHPHIYQEAIRTALRDAQTRLDAPSPALGILFFNLPMENLNSDEIGKIFKNNQALMKNVPIVGVASQSPTLQWNNRSAAAQGESILALLLP